MNCPGLSGDHHDHDHHHDHHHKKPKRRFGPHTPPAPPPAPTDRPGIRVRPISESAPARRPFGALSRRPARVRVRVRVPGADLGREGGGAVAPVPGRHTHTGLAPAHLRPRQSSIYILYVCMYVCIFRISISISISI